MMFWKNLVVSLGLALAASSCAGISSSPPALRYEPAVVRLRGTVELEWQYGPPNYGENPETDSRDLIAVLQLDKTVSVAGDPKSSSNTESFDNVERIQLVTLDGRPFSPYAGKPVEVVGTLFARLTGHHYTDVLVIVKRIEVRPR